MVLLHCKLQEVEFSNSPASVNSYLQGGNVPRLAAFSVLTFKQKGQQESTCIAEMT